MDCSFRYDCANERDRFGQRYYWGTATSFYENQNKSQYQVRRDDRKDTDNTNMTSTHHVESSGTFTLHNNSLQAETSVAFIHTQPAGFSTLDDSQSATCSLPPHHLFYAKGTHQNSLPRLSTSPTTPVPNRIPPSHRQRPKPRLRLHTLMRSMNIRKIKRGDPIELLPLREKLLLQNAQ